MNNLVRSIWVGLLFILVWLFLCFTTTIIYFEAFVQNKNNYADEIHVHIIKDTISSLRLCEVISDYRQISVYFFPLALFFIFICYCSLRLEKDAITGRIRRACKSWIILFLYDYNFFLDSLAPMKPFSTKNRFITATIFGVITYDVLKIFEESLFGSYQTMSHGVLIELVMRIAIIMIVG